MTGAVVLLALWTVRALAAGVPPEVRAVELELARLLEDAQRELPALELAGREGAPSRERGRALSRLRVLRGRLVKARGLRQDHQELVEGYRASRGARMAIDAVNRRPISHENPVFAWAHEADREENRLYGLWLGQWSRLQAAESRLEALAARAEERALDRLALCAGAAAAAVIVFLAYASWRVGRIT